MIEEGDAITGEGSRNAWPRWSFARSTLLGAALLEPVAILVFLDFEVGFSILIVPFGAITLASIALAAFGRRPSSLALAGALIALPPTTALVLGGFVPIAANPGLGANSRGVYLALAALLIGVPGSVLAYVGALGQRPLPRVGSGWTTPHGAYTTAILSLTAGLIVASLLFDARRDEAKDFHFDLAAPIVLVAEDFDFVPNHVTLRAGEIVQLRVHNRDAVYHTFTYEKDGQRYTHDLRAASVTDLLVRFDEPGQHVFWSRHDDRRPGDEDGRMTGTITVTAPGDENAAGEFVDGGWRPRA